MNDGNIYDVGVVLLSPTLDHTTLNSPLVCCGINHPRHHRQALIFRDEITMSRRSLPMQLVLDSSSDDDDDEFFLSSTHMTMNADESDNETKQRGSIKGHRVLQ